MRPRSTVHTSIFICEQFGNRAPNRWNSGCWKKDSQVRISSLYGRASLRPTPERDIPLAIRFAPAGFPSCPLRRAPFRGAMASAF
jgi:hypothetical protein